MSVTERLERLESLLTAKVLAQMLAVSAKTIYKWNAHGLPHLRLRTAVRYDPLAVAEWLREREIR